MTDLQNTDRPLRLEYLDPAQLSENPRNWRTHPAAQMRALGGVMNEVGWAGALLYNERTHRLLDGHARRKLFAERGELVPVLIGSWPEEVEQKILATLDPIAGMAEANDAAHQELLESAKLSTHDDAARELLAQLSERSFRDSLVKLADLKFHPRNYKRHPDDQLEHIMESIRLHGFYRNVVVARDNTILAGQGVVQAAVKMNYKFIPVIRLDLDPNEPRALKVLTSDNEIGKLGDVDDRALTELLKEIMDSDGLLGTGYNEQQLAGLLYATRPEGEIKDFNEAAEWVGMPAYTPAEQPIRLVVSFEDEAKRDEFMQLIGAKVVQKKSSGQNSSKTWSIWWPERTKQDLSSLKFATDDPNATQRPIPEADNKVSF